MGKRRSARRVTREGVRFGTRGTRIRIPPSPYRPIKVKGKDVVRWEAMQSDPVWHVVHRRGPGRPVVGEDPLERRAVSEESVTGFLSERIVYRWLIGARLTPDVDFDFQSSMQGGRLQMGGLVVDFIFPRLMIALRIQGPTHVAVIRMRKDQEQRLILEAMGFKVYDLDLPTILNEMEFTRFMRNMLFNEKMGGTTVMQWAHRGQEEGAFEMVWEQATRQLGNMAWGIQQRT